MRRNVHWVVILTLLAGLAVQVTQAEEAAGKREKSGLAVLPALFSQHFKPEISFDEIIEASGDRNLKIVFTTEYESRMQAPSMTVSLTEAFVDSRKFDVLERSRLSETLDEIDFGQSDYGDISRVVPMGKALNAEYVVLPEVDVICVVKDLKEVPYVDTVQPRLRGKIVVRVKVVETASTKIVAAATEEIQAERTIKADDPFAATQINDLVLDLYRAASMRIVRRTLRTMQLHDREEGDR